MNPILKRALVEALIVIAVAGVMTAVIASRPRGAMPPTPIVAGMAVALFAAYRFVGRRREARLKRKPVALGEEL